MQVEMFRSISSKETVRSVHELIIVEYTVIRIRYPSSHMH